VTGSNGSAVENSDALSPLAAKRELITITSTLLVNDLRDKEGIRSSSRGAKVEVGEEPAGSLSRSNMV